MRQHIQMLGSHYATGHPAVNRKKFDAIQRKIEAKNLAEKELAKQERHYLNFFECNFEHLAALSDTEFRQLMDHYFSLADIHYDRKTKEKKGKDFVRRGKKLKKDIKKLTKSIETFPASAESRQYTKKIKHRSEKWTFRDVVIVTTGLGFVFWWISMLGKSGIGEKEWVMGWGVMFAILIILRAICRRLDLEYKCDNCGSIVEKSSSVCPECKFLFS